MTPQLKFTLKILLMLTSCLILVIGIVMPQYSEEYMASLRDKFARVKMIDEPKIILVGGSNVAFGFDSELLENEMEMPVVNFGLHANLSQSFVSDLIKKQLNPGDIVVLAPEYYDYLDEKCDYVIAWLAIENDMPLFTAAAFSGHLGGMLDAFPTYFHRAMKRFLKNDMSVDNELARRLFNERGDYNAMRPHRIVEVGETNSFASDFLSDFLRDYWNELDDLVLKEGAVLYMSCPPIVGESLMVDLDDLQTELEDKLNFPVISTLTDYVYPLDNFYDTGFHLNDYGRMVRTEQLVKDLKNISNYDIIIE